MNDNGFLKSQTEIIELISSGVELDKILKYILSSAEKYFSSRKISGFIMLYSSGENEFSHAISASLPKNCIDLITSQIFRPSVGSSTNTEFFKRIIFSSIRHNSLIWEKYKSLAGNDHNFQAYCSFPIFSTEKKLLGTLSFFCENSLANDEEALKNIQTYSQLAAISIEISQKDQAEPSQDKVYFLNSEKQFKKKKEEYENMLFELNNALERMEFEIYYQPYFGIHDQTMGMEALIRWNHPNNGLLAPAAFLGIAEETGFILEIEKWVLFQSLHEVKNLHQRGFNNLTLSVNISAKQLENKDFPFFISELLKKIEFQPHLLTLEVTERFLVNQETIITLKHLKSIGIQLSIDDFGTAYSSLQYLKDLPVDEVKIDRSFISGLETNVTNQKIVEMIILLGHQLNMRVVAEGVETKRQYYLLKEMGCDIVQGYLFSKPVPLNTFQRKFFKEGQLGGMQL